MYNQNKKGFTLIELLIVIGIIAILAAAVIITVTPGQKLKDARDATRASHIAAIGSAVHLQIVNQGNAYDAVGDIVTGACATEVTSSCATTILGIGTHPIDPSGGNYQISVTQTTRVLIKPSAAGISDGSSYSAGVVY